MIFKGVVRKVYPYELGRKALSSGDFVLFEGEMAIVTETLNTIKLKASGNEVLIDESNVDSLQELAVELSQESIINDPVLYSLKYDQWKVILSRDICDKPVQIQFVLILVINNEDRIHVAQVLSKKYHYTYTEAETQQLVATLYNEMLSSLPADIAAGRPTAMQWWNNNKNIFPKISPLTSRNK